MPKTKNHLNVSLALLEELILNDFSKTEELIEKKWMNSAQNSVSCGVILDGIGGKMTVLMILRKEVFYGYRLFE